MPFKRNLIPENFSSGDPLYEDLMGIGFKFTGDKYTKDPNIEDTLVAGAITGLLHEEGRIVSMMTDWISLHYERINMDRLFKILLSLDQKVYFPVVIYFCANSQRLTKDVRTGAQKIKNLYQGNRRNYLAVLQNTADSSSDGTNLLIRKNGEDERFKHTCLKVPNLYIRHRPKDVLDPKALSKLHLPYRYRIMLGATYRADMWAALRKNPDYNPSDLARFSYGNYEMARKAKADYLIVKRDYSARAT